jgi:hypothetical protein
MDLQAKRILLASILETQECLQEQFEIGDFDSISIIWKLQREKAERLRNGDYYTQPHSRGITKADERDGQGS